MSIKLGFSTYTRTEDGFWVCETAGDPMSQTLTDGELVQVLANALNSATRLRDKLDAKISDLAADLLNIQRLMDGN